MAEPDLTVGFSPDVSEVRYVREGDVVLCPLAMLFAGVDFDALRRAVRVRWALS